MNKRRYFILTGLISRIVIIIIIRAVCRKFSYYRGYQPKPTSILQKIGMKLDNLGHQPTEIAVLSECVFFLLCNLESESNNIALWSLIEQCQIRLL